jgi:predicted transcriptional regulator
MQGIFRKNKINLADYAYKRDIENRLFLAQLTVFETQVLEEILHHSLKISIQELAEDLECKAADLTPALKKLSSSKLFKIDHGTLIVDRERRKYYSSQIEKFDEGFEPDMEFIQGLLNKVPIHVLPVWYAIPRSTDNIIASIIERYLLTPEIYRQYLAEVQFDDPIIIDIIKDLNLAPGFRIASSELIAKYNLTREQFEEYILLLEYHFICCIHYEKLNDEWQEIVTPFQEWLDYLRFETRTIPRPIQDIEQITPIIDTGEFVFIKDMQTVLKACKRKSLKEKEIHALLDRPSAYISHLVAKAIQVEFLKPSYQLLEKGEEWLEKSKPDQSVSLSVDSLNTLLSIEVSSHLYAPRNMRLLEKSLIKKLSANQWVYVDDFLEGFTASIGDKEPIVLKNKGKKWCYALPIYSEEEQQFMKAVLIERFFELGIVNVGVHNKKTCFALTAFGRVSLS